MKNLIKEVTQRTFTGTNNIFHPILLIYSSDKGCFNYLLRETSEK